MFLNVMPSLTTSQSYGQGRQLARPLTFLRQRAGLNQRTFLLMIALAGFTQLNANNHGLDLRESAAAMKNPKAVAPVTFQTIAKGYRSGVRAPLQAVVRTQNEWDTLWRKHSSVDATVAPLPVIDFDNQMVVGLFLGDKPTGGYDVEVLGAERTDDALMIYYREKNPPAGSMLTQALTQPFHIARIIGSINSKVVFRSES